MLKVLIIGLRFKWYNDSIREYFEANNCNAHVHKTHMGLQKKNYLMRLKNRFGMDISSFLKQRQEKESQAAWDVFTVYKPNIVFVLKGTQINARTIMMMKRSAITILNMTDSVVQYPELLDVASAYDKVYTFEKGDIQILKQQNIIANPLMGSVDDSKYFPMLAEKNVDVSFVGAMYPLRRKILRQLVYDLPEVKFEFYGEYGKLRHPVRYMQVLFGKEKQAFKNKIIDFTQVNDLYNRSKLCLNIHHQQSKDGWNSRLTEILGAGAFQIVDANPAIISEFEGCLVMYYDYEDLKNKIIFYLENVKERERIAKKGHKLVMERHTMKKAIARILSDID